MVFFFLEIVEFPAELPYLVFKEIYHLLNALIHCELSCFQYELWGLWLLILRINPCEA